MGQNFEPISYATTKSSRSLEEADAVLNIPPATLAAAFLEGAAFLNSVELSLKQKLRLMSCSNGAQVEEQVQIDVLQDELEAQVLNP